MVGHYHIGVQFIEFQFALCKQQSIHHTLGNAAVLEPHRAGEGSIEPTIGCQKFLRWEGRLRVVTRLLPRHWDGAGAPSPPGTRREPRPYLFTEIRWKRAI